MDPDPDPDPGHFCKIYRFNIFFRLFFILKLFLVDILPLGSGDPHIFAVPDPDPESQNLADPTDPDPKQC